MTDTTRNHALRLLKHLNEQQRQAVTTTQGPVLVIAGPGSGKTRVIVQRIAYLITAREVDPRRILAVTFTNRAANEMIERLAAVVLPQTAKSVHVSTFHKFCGMLNRINSHRIGLNNNYSIYDRDDQTSFVERAMELAGLSTKSAGFSIPTLLSKISHAKSRLLDPEQYRQWLYEDPESDLSYAAEAAADVYPFYQNQLRMTNALDFDDMIARSVRILRESDYVRTRTQRRFQYIMVDEFQDTDHAQNVLIELLTGPQRNLCVVGDPDQSIYGWRNADIGNILGFEERRPDTAVIRLGRNYRSTQNILKAAEDVVTHNRRHLENPLTTEVGAGCPVLVAGLPDTNCEAEWIIESLAERVALRQCQWSDCAVMYRVNAQSRAFEAICFRRQIPYRLIGGTRFNQRREIKDILAYLNIIHNPGDSVSLQRIINLPPRRIGAGTVRNLMDFSDRRRQTLMQAVNAATTPETEDRPSIRRNALAALHSFHNLVQDLQRAKDHATLTQLFDRIIESTGLEEYIKSDEQGTERWDNALELRAMTERDEYAGRNASKSLPAFLESVSLVSDVDRYDPDEGALTLITLHQAKGLEFDTVAMPGLTEGTLPLARAEDIEEERRLCYVGMTRAKNCLIMSWPEMAIRNGQPQENVPSRFLDELPETRRELVFPAED